MKLPADPPLLDEAFLAKQFNHRQLAVISHAIRSAGEVYTIESHRNSHNVSYPTARTDLLSLAGMGLLEKHKVRNTFVFEAVQDMESRIESLRKRSG